MASAATLNTVDHSPRSTAAQLHPAENPYGPTFWWCYAANTLLMVAVSLLFRYSDFIKHLGASEGWLGIVVGVGIVGALSSRAVQSVAIDRYGAGRVWMASQWILLVSVLAHLLISTAYSPLLFVCRVGMLFGIAGSFGASITFVSLRVPQRRVAEMVGMLGSSGFVGMALGPTLGDWIMGTGQIDRADIVRMFLLASAAVLVSLACTFMASRKTAVRRLKRQPSALLLLKRYHPGMILLVSAAMGIGVTLPHVFLKPYADEVQIASIKWFFIAYAATAFTVRIATRNVTEVLGIKPTILLGFGFLCASMIAYLPAKSALWLVLPAALGGAAHALLFPAIVAGGSTAFPERYRGLGTTLVLAMFDIGNLVGQPAVGGTIEIARSLAWPPYETMFLCLAMSLGAIATLYAFSSGRVRPTAAVRRHRREQRVLRKRSQDSAAFGEQSSELAETPSRSA